MEFFFNYADNIGLILQNISLSIFISSRVSFQLLVLERTLMPMFIYDNVSSLYFLIIFPNVTVDVEMRRGTRDPS